MSSVARTPQSDKLSKWARRFVDRANAGEKEAMGILNAAGIGYRVSQCVRAGLVREPLTRAKVQRLIA